MNSTVFKGHEYAAELDRNEQLLSSSPSSSPSSSSSSQVKSSLFNNLAANVAE